MGLAVFLGSRQTSVFFVIAPYRRTFVTSFVLSLYFVFMI